MLGSYNRVIPRLVLLLYLLIVAVSDCMSGNIEQLPF